MYKYDISVFAWYGSLYDVMNCIKNIQTLSNEHASNIASIKELRKLSCQQSRLHDGELTY